MMGERRAVFRFEGWSSSSLCGNADWLKCWHELPNSVGKCSQAHTVLKLSKPPDIPLLLLLLERR
jgi:hypothetical protein